MQPTAFWHSELWECVAAIEGFQELEERRLREQYELSRLNAFWLLSPHVKKGKELKLHHICRFPWEQQAVKVSKETIDKNLEIILERDRRQKNNLTTEKRTLSIEDLERELKRQ